MYCNYYYVFGIWFLVIFISYLYGVFVMVYSLWGIWNGVFGIGCLKCGVGYIVFSMVCLLLGFVYEVADMMCLGWCVLWGICIVFGMVCLVLLI